MGERVAISKGIVVINGPGSLLAQALSIQALVILATGRAFS